MTATALGVDEQIVKSASQGTSAGCGIRVLSGERTGYAYTDNLSPERLLHAARTAALIASGPAKQPVQGFVEAPDANLYPVPLGGYDLDLAARLELILRADRAARAFDPRIVQVRASYSEELRRILIAASDGAFASDTQPLCRLNVFVIAKEDANTTKGSAGGGGRAGLEQFTGTQKPGAPGARGRPRSDSATGRGACSGRARWKWCWAPAGRESCCMKRWATAWKPTSTARRHRPLPG